MCIESLKGLISHRDKNVVSLSVNFNLQGMENKTQGNTECTWYNRAVGDVVFCLT